MAKVDRIIKGLCAAFTLAACYSMSLGSGGSLNPALGLTQSIYMIGLDNRKGSTLGHQEAKYMWVYVVSPFFGAILAAVFYKFHLYVDNNEYK